MITAWYVHSLLRNILHFFPLPSFSTDGYSDILVWIGYSDILTDISVSWWIFREKRTEECHPNTFRQVLQHKGFIPLWIPQCQLRLRGLCQLRQFRNSSSVKISRSHTQSAHQRWVLVCFSVWVSSHLTGAKRREWMGLLGVAMGVAGIVINSYYGSFPHSLRLAPVSHL